MAAVSPDSPDEHANGGQRNFQRSVHAAPEEFERGAITWLSHASRSLGRASDSFLASIEYVSMDEMPDESVTTNPSGADGDIHLYKSMHFKSEWIISLDESLYFDLDSFLTRLYVLSEQHAAHLTKGIINHISETSIAYGQVVNAADRPFFDVYCESLENLEFTFDDDGKPNITLLVHPETAAQIPTFTPEQQLAIDQIVQRKRDEWNAKRRRRKLPELPD